MSKISEILQQIVNKKQEQLDRLLNSNQSIQGVIAASPEQISEAEEALLRDQLQLELRLEMEEDRKRLNECRIIPPEKQSTPEVSLIEQMKARYNRKVEISEKDQMTEPNKESTNE